VSEKLITSTIVVAVVLSTAGQAYGQMQDLRLTKKPHIRSVTDHSAIIQWSTNISSTALVKYGTEFNNLNYTVMGTGGGKTHSVKLNNLRSGMLLHQVILSPEADSSIRAISYIDEFNTDGELVPYYTERVNSGLP
jgi:hypothetical protein